MMLGTLALLLGCQSFTLYHNMQEVFSLKCHIFTSLPLIEAEYKIKWSGKFAHGIINIESGGF